MYISGKRVVCVAYVRISSTQYLNVNQALLNAGHAVIDHHDNEFNPPWPTYVGEPYTPPPLTPNLSPLAKIIGPKFGTSGLKIQFIGDKSYDPDHFLSSYVM